MFLINSCSGLVSSTSQSLRSKSFTLAGAPSPEVTVPFCLVPSPEFSHAPWYSLPDHLCRLGVRFLVTSSLEAFPGSMASTTSPSKVGSLSVLRLEIPALPEIAASHLEHGQPTPCWPSLLLPPIAVTRSTRILTRFPSTTPFGLALGVDSPCVD